MALTPDLSGVPLRLTKPVYDYHQYQGDRTNDCGPTSAAIAVNALLDQWVLEGPAVAEEMSHVAFECRPFPHLVVPRIREWATFPWGIVYYLKKQGFRARWRLFGTLERLERNLRADRLTIVVIGVPWRWRKVKADKPWPWKTWRYIGWAHVKILFGYVPGQELLFVDPGEERSSDVHELNEFGLFVQDQEQFLRQWRNILRIFIEVEGHLGDWG